MSYILDALKRAEADRNPDTRASLALEQQERRKHRLLLYGLLAALIANATLLLWLFVPESLLDERGEATEAAAIAPASEAARGTLRQAQPQPVGDGRTEAEPEARPTPQTPIVADVAPRQEASATASQTRPTVGTTVLPNPAKRPQAAPASLASLSPADRSRFPELSFSTHIYADAPELRAVVVNGTRLTEGDRLGSLRLREITEEGAVFEFEGQLVSVSVLDGWQ